MRDVTGDPAYVALCDLAKRPDCPAELAATMAMLIGRIRSADAECDGLREQVKSRDATIDRLLGILEGRR